MKAIILVLKKASFQFTGKATAKQHFPAEREVAQPGQTVELNRGIYVVNPNNDPEPHGVKPTSGARGTDYILLELAGKDVWPDPRVTIQEQFSEMNAAQVDTVVADISRTVS